MRFHQHPQGEEIFIAMGELQDERGHYPAGTWQRLHPETGHAPYSETDTLILLRMATYLLNEQMRHRHTVQYNRNIATQAQHDSAVMSIH